MILLRARAKLVLTVSQAVALPTMPCQVPPMSFGDFLDAEDAIVECEVLFNAGVMPDLRPARSALERAGMHASVCAGAKAHVCLLAARLGALGRVFPA